MPCGRKRARTISHLSQQISLHITGEKIRSLVRHLIVSHYPQQTTVAIKVFGHALWEALLTASLVSLTDGSSPLQCLRFRLTRGIQGTISLRSHTRDDQ